MFVQLKTKSGMFIYLNIYHIVAANFWGRPINRACRLSFSSEVDTSALKGIIDWDPAGVIQLEKALIETAG